jgi:hypothetical protein
MKIIPGDQPVVKDDPYAEVNFNSDRIYLTLESF